jgi:hypothetical protein
MSLVLEREKILLGKIEKEKKGERKETPAGENPM